MPTAREIVNVLSEAGDDDLTYILHDPNGSPINSTITPLALANSPQFTTKYAAINHTHAGSEAFPVGSVFISVVSTNPATLLGYGTWSAFGAGRVLVGLDAGDPDFNTVEETGGSKTHALTTNEMPAHSHLQDAHGHTVNDPGHTHLTQRYPTATGGSSGFTIDTSMSGTLADNTLPTKTATTGVTVNNATAVNQNTGGGAAHNNMPPFLVCYFWKRTA